ncbi:MAG: histone deacetylase family protein [Acidimicrobiia bacterium]
MRTSVPRGSHSTVLLVASDPTFEDHDPGRGHPERPARLRAVAAGIDESGLDGAIAALPARDATDDELLRVHTPTHIERLRRLSARGGGSIDPDTVTSPGSWTAAVRAAGAGLAAVDALESGEGKAAFLALRPPGHHAGPATSMGFCLLNNVAVTAAALAARGERVGVIDYDAHHGNGTQEVFYADPRVLCVSFHEWPLYPGTGRLDETGAGAGAATTCNLPLPAGATGDLYLRALDDVVEPIMERFGPDWLLVSAGFDAHRADPLTGLGLSAGDYGALARRMAELAPAGRLILFLEGGYDPDALRASVAATLPPLVGEPARAAESATANGPGGEVVAAAADLWTGLPLPDPG